MTDVIPVTFDNPDGLKLFGIFYQPDPEKRKDIGILLLSPGVKTRVAPHRLYKKMAEQFCAMGYPVFRFDYYGLGDSEGEVDDHYLADFYGAVQVGKYVGDTQAALDWFEEEHGIAKVVFAGLCGGALTGLLAAGDDHRVIGLLGLGTPVILDSTNIDKSKYITQGQLNDLKTSYIKKVLSPKAWARFLTFKSDFRVIFKIISQVAARQLGKLRRETSDNAEKLPADVDMSNFNQLFPPAFFRMTSDDRKLLFVFSGADRLAWEFEEKFVPQYKQQLESCSENYEIHTIEQANHILSDKKWVNEMMKYASNWLNKYYC